jgi:zinc D-Ala-D-Ala dipeptidase
MLHRAPKVVLMSDPRVGGVPLQDCGEDLVDTRDAISATACADGDCWYTSSRWVRGSVRDRLVHAAQLLSPVYTLALDEGWRPPAIQARVFDRQVRRLAEAHPNERLESLRRLASRFVAPPDVAPHPTGAAVDVVLLGRDGTEVDMGCPINTNPEDSAGCATPTTPTYPTPPGTCAPRWARRCGGLAL